MPSLSDALTSRMDYLADRQSVIAGNIANADTPGYLPADLDFTPYLKAAQGGMGGGLPMAVTNPAHLAGAQGSAVRNKLVTSARFVQHNGNAVRLDDQMIKMNQTQLNYRMATEIYAKQSEFQRLALDRQQ
jgi:flagellar basal-body rod protein FlgB